VARLRWAEEAQSTFKNAVLRPPGFLAGLETAFGSDLEGGKRSRRRLEGLEIFWRGRDGVCGLSGVRGKVQTASEAHSKFQQARKRRLRHLWKFRRLSDGGFNASLG